MRFGLVGIFAVRLEKCLRRPFKDTLKIKADWGRFMPLPKGRAFLAQVYVKLAVQTKISEVLGMLLSYTRVDIIGILSKIKKAGLSQEEVYILADLLQPKVLASDTITALTPDSPLATEYPEPVVYKNDQPSGNIVTLDIPKSRRNGR